MSIGKIALLVSIVFILITDNKIKKGKVFELRNILIIKILGIVFLFLSIILMILEKK